MSRQQIEVMELRLNMQRPGVEHAIVAECEATPLPHAVHELNTRRHGYL